MAKTDNQYRVRHIGKSSEELQREMGSLVFNINRLSDELETVSELYEASLSNPNKEE